MPVATAVDQPTRRTNLDSLTSLRWFAALVVFGVHTGFSTGLKGNLLLPGVSGVSFFYLLSGFVMVWAARAADTPGAFYLRRFARIYPTHAVTWLLLLVTAIAPAYYSPYTAKPFVTGLFLVQAWVPKSSYFYAGNGVAWSLSCEMFFYLTFPFLFSVLRRLGNRALVAVASTAFGLVATFNVTAWSTTSAHDLFTERSRWYWFIYIFPPTRLLEFVIGCVLALYIQRTGRFPIPASVAFVLSVTCYFLTDLTPHPAVATAVPLIPFTLLIGALAARDLRGSWTPLTARWLVTLGQWSFAFYMIHQIVLRAVSQRVWDGALPLAKRHLTMDIAGFLCAVAAAALLHYLVERPCERFIRSRARRTTPLPVSG